jgi:hypothetical protein
MEARFTSLTKNINRHSTARWSLLGLVFTLAVCLVVGCDLAGKSQADPTLPTIPTESPTPSATSTPLVVSSADSGTLPTWTDTPTPRRPTALAMTLQAQFGLTQTLMPPTPSPLYTITRTPTITTTYYYKVFPTVTLRLWPTYTFTPRPTFTPLPTLNQQQTKNVIHKIETATAKTGKTLTATAWVENDIQVADVPNDLSGTAVPTEVYSASGEMPLVLNANWQLDGKGLLFEGNVFDQRRIYTFALPDGPAVRLPGQNQQLLKTNPPKNNKDNIQPALSPDGKWIAFSSLPVNDRTHHHIFIMSMDGSVLYQVTKGIYNEELQPSWSPDSKDIIFISVQYGYFSQIFQLNVNWLGKSTTHTPEDIYVSETPLTTTPGINIETAPRYCMDKNKAWILFSANVGSRQIYWMKSDGTGVQKLTKDYGNSFPDWSSKCDTIIFVPEIVTQSVNWDGDPLVPSLTEDPVLLISNESGYVSSPHFSPNDSEVVFIHRNHP